MEVLMKNLMDLTEAGAVKGTHKKPNTAVERACIESQEMGLSLDLWLDV